MRWGLGGQGQKPVATPPFHPPTPALWVCRAPHPVCRQSTQACTRGSLTFCAAPGSPGNLPSKIRPNHPAHLHASKRAWSAFHPRGPTYFPSPPHPSWPPLLPSGSFSPSRHQGRDSVPFSHWRVVSVENALPHCVFWAATCLHIRGQLPGSLLCSASNVPTAPGTLPSSVLSKLDFVQLPSMDGSSPLSLTEDLLIHCYTPGTVSGQDAPSQIQSPPPALLDFHERRQMKY